jgi:hypothetical protein
MPSKFFRFKRVAQHLALMPFVDQVIRDLMHQKWTYLPTCGVSEGASSQSTYRGMGSKWSKELALFNQQDL